MGALRRTAELIADRRGGVMAIAAAGAAAMFGVAALVVDVSAIYGEQNRLQTVADLAALGAAQNLPDRAAAAAAAHRLINAGLECERRRRPGPADQASQQGKDAVAAKRPDRPGADCGHYSATIDAASIRFGNWNASTGRLEEGGDNPTGIQIELERSSRLENALPTTFAQLFGLDMFDLAAGAVAARGGGGGMELALVLDVSNSMRSNGKIQRLREISIAMIDSLYAGQETQRNLWVSVVPFAGRVNIARYGRHWMAESPPVSPLLCTGLRSGTRKNDDTPPGVERFPLFKGNNCTAAPMLALTRERSIIRAELQALDTTHGTSTQIGTVWGWRALSPAWRGLWGDPNLPHDYGTPGIRKVAVIMTDGMNRPQHSGDPFTTAEADAQLLAQCHAMKAVGITIYTITFDAPAAIDPIYQECASDPEKFYRASTADQLALAFQTIGDSLIGRPRLVR